MLQPVQHALLECWQGTEMWHLLLDFPAWLQHALHLVFCPEQNRDQETAAAYVARYVYPLHRAQLVAALLSAANSLHAAAATPEGVVKWLTGLGTDGNKLCSPTMAPATPRKRTAEEELSAPRQRHCSHGPGIERAQAGYAVIPTDSFRPRNPCDAALNHQPSLGMQPHTLDRFQQQHWWLWAVLVPLTLLRSHHTVKTSGSLLLQYVTGNARTPEATCGDTPQPAANEVGAQQQARLRVARAAALDALDACLGCWSRQNSQGLSAPPAAVAEHEADTPAHDVVIKAATAAYASMLEAWCSDGSLAGEEVVAAAKRFSRWLCMVGHTAMHGKGLKVLEHMHELSKQLTSGPL